MSRLLSRIISTFLAANVRTVLALAGICRTFQNTLYFVFP